MLRYPIQLGFHAVFEKRWAEYNAASLMPEARINNKIAELLPVSRTPGLGVMTKLELAYGTTTAHTPGMLAWSEPISSEP